MNEISRLDEDLTRGLDRFFGPRFMERFFGPAVGRLADRQTFGLSDWAPAVDVAETDDAYQIRADLPSLDKGDVHVDVKDGMLVIAGERRHERTEDDPNKRWHRVERTFGRFQRSFTLPQDVDPERIEATCKDGVLEVSLPKTHKTDQGTRSIEVR